MRSHLLKSLLQRLPPYRGPHCQPYRRQFCGCREAQCSLPMCLNSSYIAEQGTLFGERSSLLVESHMTTAVSIVDSSVYAIPINIFQDRLAASPALNQAVLKILCRKNSLLVGRLLSHSPSVSLQRIAQVLLDMVHAYGTETESGCEISIRFRCGQSAPYQPCDRDKGVPNHVTGRDPPPQSGTHPDLRPK